MARKVFPSQNVDISTSIKYNFSCLLFSTYMYYFQYPERDNFVPLPTLTFLKINQCRTIHFYFFKNAFVLLRGGPSYQPGPYFTNVL